MTSWRVQCNKDYHYAPVLTTPLQKVAEYLPSSWLNKQGYTVKIIITVRLW